jgi:predicted dehydrogenase
MIRVGLVGFGLGGRVFHAPLISSVDGLQLAAVVERTSNHAAERYPGIKTYRAIEEMLADATLDLIVISTPSGMHFEQARQALEAGKNLVVDKPVCVASTEIAELIAIAAKKNLFLSAFHERRWDCEYQTTKKLFAEGVLGRLVHFESTLDRWRPATRVAWKDSTAMGGGVLLDLGTHLVDQALALFGKPEMVSAEVLRERDGEGADDAFTVRLQYPRLSVVLSCANLASLARPRLHLRGTKGNYWKWIPDAQEIELSKITRIEGPGWGQEPPAAWGMLKVDVDGGMVTRPVESVAGDYRLYYAGVRDALLGKAEIPVTALDAWRGLRILEWAIESSSSHCAVVCDWSSEPTS